MKYYNLEPDSRFVPFSVFLQFCIAVVLLTMPEGLERLFHFPVRRALWILLVSLTACPIIRLIFRGAQDRTAEDMLRRYIKALEVLKED